MRKKKKEKKERMLPEDFRSLRDPNCEVIDRIKSMTVEQKEHLSLTTDWHDEHL